MTWTTSCTGKMSPTGRWILLPRPLGKQVELLGLTPSLSCPSRVYEYPRIPPLINRVPVKIRRTQVGLGVKSSFSAHKGARKSHLPREQIKLQTEELHSIRGELSQIKAQVDRLLENLERMDQQRDQLPG
ncbi:heterogeneous nuclear ribonucleoproteins C1/C2-like [Mirounga leonina]|uniref:heterogeneous nuclear ribonucleoproteins C1/C2-like n=1 Tax=Mirounga leonina TaxID=9715 RepID=UPI00156BF1C8|nr:heterogeneous nuclear ribonucleoproteins C1/C2-like [Mirounga leonina]